MTILMSSQKERLKFLQPLPEAVHVGKCMKSSFANWFLSCDGQRFNLSNLHVLYNDCADLVKNAVRQAVTLSAVCNRDRISAHDLILIVQERLVNMVSEVPSIVQTVVPEMFCLHKGNSRGVLDHPVSVCCASQSKLLLQTQPSSNCFVLIYTTLLMWK